MWNLRVQAPNLLWAIVWALVVLIFILPYLVVNV